MTEKDMAKLDFELSENLPEPPLFLVDMARNSKKIQEIRDKSKG